MIEGASFELVQHDSVRNQDAHQNGDHENALAEPFQPVNDAGQVFPVAVAQPGKHIGGDEGCGAVNQQEAFEWNTARACDEKAGEPKSGKISTNQNRSVTEALVKALEPSDLFFSRSSGKKPTGLEANPAPHRPGDAITQNDADVPNNHRFCDGGLPHTRDHAAREKAQIFWHRVAERRCDQRHKYSNQPVCFEKVQGSVQVEGGCTPPNRFGQFTHGCTNIGQGILLATG